MLYEDLQVEADIFLSHFVVFEKELLFRDKESPLLSLLLLISWKEVA